MTKPGILPPRITFLCDILYRESNVPSSQWNGKKHNICKEGMYTGQLNSIFYPGIIACTYMRTLNFGSKTSCCSNPINSIFFLQLLEKEPMSQPSGGSRIPWLWVGQQCAVASSCSSCREILLPGCWLMDSHKRWAARGQQQRLLWQTARS